MGRLLAYCLALFGSFFFVTCTHYTPDWNSLDSRPLPSWFDEAKIGIMMHLSVFSVPSFRSGWFWLRWKVSKFHDVVKFMEDNYPPNFTYQDFGPQFTLEFFNASAYADLVKTSGAKYFVFTTKHHEGFANFPSPYTFGWNSVDVGPKRDVVGELRNAFLKHPDIHFGLYYSLREWFNPLYHRDQTNHFNTQDYVNNKMIPEMKYLVENYKPDLLWADGCSSANSTYFKSKEFLAWLYNDSPVKDTVCVNDRWGRDTKMRHGGYYSGHDRFNPGHLVNHKFEGAFSVDKVTFPFRRKLNIDDVLTIEEIVQTIASVVSCNGNVLLNIGPTKEGTISPIFQERLAQVGNWLKINGEAIYGTRPWTHQKDGHSVTPQVWYTSKQDVVYGISLGWPDNGILTLGDVKTSGATQVYLIGWPKPLTFSSTAKGVLIKFPDFLQYLNTCGQVCQVGQGFTLKFTNLYNAV